nr:hypothetical protein [Aurantimonas marina]
MVAEDPAVTSGGLETDRRAFLSCHGNSEHPPGATDVLVGGAGWTLDPVMTLRARIRLAPEPGHNSPS